MKTEFHKYDDVPVIELDEEGNYNISKWNKILTEALYSENPEQLLESYISPIETQALGRKPRKKRKVEPFTASYNTKKIKSQTEWKRKACNNLQDPNRRQKCLKSLDNEIANRYNTLRLICKTRRCFDAMSNRSNRASMKLANKMGGNQ